ncbi:MAG: hypothetical protein G3M78_04215 [Candidatus Nitrohelix vancouverensis]|uniref:DsrE/DsrF-like family protein n=1 Tax=Candidatus Nitrohelix vancouverensis TaxID=2705534 RepID=A0A7T0G2W0_9BACT|nr:MAG: hypothetical protein G3M78_04215 [Candidatus Nitrohelix vancouverensis]
MKFLMTFFLGLVLALSSATGASAAAEHRGPDGKLKVLYHIDSADVELVKYAMALVNKHIDAEGGPDKIDVVVVVHGPALNLFDKELADPTLVSRLKLILDKGAQPEMCQVSMKLFNKPLDSLVPGFLPTEHPVAVKRIADLQEQGYIYIKP